MSPRATSSTQCVLTRSAVLMRVRVGCVALVCAARRCNEHTRCRTGVDALRRGSARRVGRSASCGPSHVDAVFRATPAPSCRPCYASLAPRGLRRQSPTPTGRPTETDAKRRRRGHGTCSSTGRAVAASSNEVTAAVSRPPPATPQRGGGGTCIPPPKPSTSTPPGPRDVQFRESSNATGAPFQQQQQQQQQQQRRQQ